MITIEDFHKLNIVIGDILSAKNIDGSEKLLVLTVDVGEDKPRQIISGISRHVEDVEELVGKKFPFLINLEPRTLMGYKSEGMIIAAGNESGDIALLSPDTNLPVGTPIR